MARTKLMQLAILIVILEVGASFALSLLIAKRMAQSELSERALGYARDVRKRAEATGDQISYAFERLAPLREAAPCSDEELALFRSIDLSADNIQSMGRVVGGAMPCSSYGRHQPALPLGAVDYVSPARVRFRRAARFPFAPNRRYIVLERDGFAAIVHKAAPLDVNAAEPDVVLAVVAKREGQLLSGRGSYDPAWMQRGKDLEELSFVDAGNVVAVSRSLDYNIV